MKNKFSFSRIGLMLRADWIEYKKAFLLFAGLLVAANLFLFANEREGFQAFLFVAGIFSTFTAFYIYVGWKVHRAKNRLLTLPASTMEKFVEIKTVAFILFCVYFLIYTIILGIVYLKTGATIWLLSIFEQNVDKMAVFMGIGVVLFITAFQYMCCVALRKFPLGVGTLFLFVYVFAIVYTTLVCFKIDNPNLFAVDFNFHSDYIRSNAIFDTIIFLTTNFAWCMYVSAAVLMYISYLKLKEKQIR